MSKWSKRETEALLELWADERVQSSLNSLVHNKDIFANICTQMEAMGFNRNVDQLQNKIKALRKKLTDTQTHNNRSGVSAKTFVGYDIMK